MRTILAVVSVLLLSSIACAGGSPNLGNTTVEVSSGGTDAASVEVDWLAALSQPGTPFTLTLTEQQVEAALTEEFAGQGSDSQVSDVTVNFDDGLARLTYGYTFDLPNRPTATIILDLAINVVNGDLRVETQQAEIANENLSFALPAEATDEIDAELTRLLSAESVSYDGTVTYTAVTVDNDVFIIEGVAER